MAQLSIGSLLRRLVDLGARRTQSNPQFKVLFVCMANVCRSPTAEAVFRSQIAAAGLAQLIVCDSAGTHDFNAGKPPDGRSRQAAARRGYDMARRRGRQIRDEDFARFDLIVAMDSENLHALRERCPPERTERLRLLMDFSQRQVAAEIPDPYFGNSKAFELVLDMIEEGCESLLEHVRSVHLPQLTPPDRETP